jgi:mRNA interferase MazF
MKSKPLKRGDIVISVFPFTDLASTKRRPALVLSENTEQADVILAFISSKIPKKLSKSMVLLDSKESNFRICGLKTSSIIRLDKIATVRRVLITRRLGKLSKVHNEEVDGALINTTTTLI